MIAAMVPVFIPSRLRAPTGRLGSRSLIEVTPAVSSRETCISGERSGSSCARGTRNSAGIRRSQCRGAATAARSADPALGLLVLAWKHDMKVLSSGFDDPDGAAKLERHHRDALASGSHGTQKVVVLLRPETGIALRHGDVIKACKEEGRPVLGLAWLGRTHRASSK